jgi:hypothetical protein
MQKILTGCMIPILLFAIFLGGYLYFFLPRVDPTWLAYVLSGVSALMLCLAIGAIKTFFQTRKIAGVLRRAKQKRPPKDGELALINGEVVAVNETINAPFSNTPCVSYEYHMYRVVRTTSRRESGYRTGKDVFAFGLAKTAYRIRTSGGDVRPLGYPTLDNLSKTSRPLSETGDPQTKQRVEDFLQNEHFQKAGALGMASAFSQMMGGIEDDTDVVRKDWKVKDPDNLNGVTLDETSLEPGQQVCALGKWDEKRSALQAPVELIAGDYKNVQRLLIANKRFSAVFGLIFAIVFSAILIAFAWSFPPLSPDARPYRNESFQSIVQSAPTHVILEMCQGDVDPNQPNTLGTPPIFWVRDADKLQALFDCGADPNVRDKNGDTKLNEAARYGDAASVRVLLEAGADIEAEIPESGRGWTAMVSAYTTNHPEIVDILAGAGAYDERVTAATGEPLTDDSPPMHAIRAYLAAIQASDMHAMQQVRTGMSPEWFEDIDFEIWKKYRPAETKLKEGFGNAHAATIEVEEFAVESYRKRLFYHLEYVAEGDTTPQWRILREWDAPLPE